VSHGDDLEPFSESLNDVFARLGLPDPVLMSQVSSEWETLAGKPWVGRSTPLFVRGQTLVVEASGPSMVAYLRYGESSLLETLKERFGEGLINSIEVVPPGRA
jgi:Dna[CI] antecedent, DciA